MKLRLVGTLPFVLFLCLAMPVLGHYPDATIYSWWAIRTPTIDGAISSGEWTDARGVSLEWTDTAGACVSPTSVCAFFKNDADYLYILYDIDVAPYDNGNGFFARISFDIGHDAVRTAEAENDFVLEYTAAEPETPHVVLLFAYDTAEYYEVTAEQYSSGESYSFGWVAVGLGSSPRDSRIHPIVEWRIPLILLGASPGDTLGLAIAGSNTHGVAVFEGEAGESAEWFYAEWPDIWSGGESRPLDQYGDLVLAPFGLVIPECWLGTILSVVGCFAAFGVFYLKHRHP